MLPAAVSFTSCVYDNLDDEPEAEPSTIRVNTADVDGSRASLSADGSDNTFMLLLWEEADLVHLEPSKAWPSPYLAAHAPQPVPFFDRSVFDTRYPYPDNENAFLYATGYAPGIVVKPADGKDYRRLKVELGDHRRGRCDFMGLDLWKEVYKGSQLDPFSHDKNKLYFRHLAAKLLVIADRDKTTMENKQFVRNVRVNNLKMSTDGGTTWTTLYTPLRFDWQQLTHDTDFTLSYNKAIASAQAENQMTGAGATATPTIPTHGYKLSEAEPLNAPDDPSFTLSRNAADRVPINGLKIDSCYICNDFDTEKGIVIADKPIKLKMDVTAELSFSSNFPLTDEDSETDDFTYTRTWPGVEVSAIYKVDSNGNVPASPTAIKEFKPGNEYRIYIHFYRTGVNLTAIESDWNYGGVHYIAIPGGTPTK